jgi:hypothetical protein
MVFTPLDSVEPAEREKIYHSTWFGFAEMLASEPVGE